MGYPTLPGATARARAATGLSVGGGGSASRAIGALMQGASRYGEILDKTSRGMAEAMRRGRQGLAIQEALEASRTARSTAWHPTPWYGPRLPLAGFQLSVWPLMAAELAEGFATVFGEAMAPMYGPAVVVPPPGTTGYCFTPATLGGGFGGQGCGDVVFGFPEDYQTKEWRFVVNDPETGNGYWYYREHADDGPLPDPPIEGIHGLRVTTYIDTFGNPDFDASHPPPVPELRPGSVVIGDVVPAISPMIDPMSWPPGQPMPLTPRPVPYRLLPYRLQRNPARSPTEQSSFGNDLGTPGRAGVAGGEREPVRRGEAHFRAPPRTKERKLSGLQGALVGAAMSVTEVNDIVEAMWEALPARHRKGKHSMSDKYADLYRHWSDIDAEKAVENVVINAIEDAVIGRIEGMIDRARFAGRRHHVKDRIRTKWEDKFSRPQYQGDVAKRVSDFVDDLVRDLIEF